MYPIQLIWPADAALVVAAETQVGENGRVVTVYETRGDLAQAVHLMASFRRQDLEERLETGLEMIRECDDVDRLTRLSARLRQLLDRHELALEWERMGERNSDA